eukprot:gnl/TRDRNA2_/TRDRNA2_198620_c0_seq1.p1 gnl/TRDRNA2_/TRDRNA2_198620_c0~~gnl/TRDRNA2_/TRDRNA2_198620_c0_seq1.p1  ORF type:complete len:236 (-),score=32.67 gnl/TRDRNA2_/TRDRNA2_198620_c0_seq1:13-720(-)
MFELVDDDVAVERCGQDLRPPFNDACQSSCSSNIGAQDVPNSSDAEEAPASVRKYIFLDVDGVLHPVKGALRSFHPSCMQALAQIVRATGAEIVLSSSWRKTDIQRRAVDAALVKHGLSKAIGRTVCCQADFVFNDEGMRKSRAAEIQLWLSTNCKLGDRWRWVALDDMDMTLDLGRNMIVTDPDDGLTAFDADAAIAVLNDTPVASTVASSEASFSELDDDNDDSSFDWDSDSD